jgi:hypothetical protein
MTVTEAPVSDFECAERRVRVLLDVLRGLPTDMPDARSAAATALREAIRELMAAGK